MKQFNTLNNMYHYLTDNGPTRYLFGDTPGHEDWHNALVALKHNIETSAVVGATYKSQIDIPDYGTVNTLVEINRKDGIWTLMERIDNN